MQLVPAFGELLIRRWTFRTNRAVPGSYAAESSQVSSTAGLRNVHYNGIAVSGHLVSITPSKRFLIMYIPED